MEFGVVAEDGELRAYGAGLLSSFGEIEAFRDAEVRPWNLGEMAEHDYDITHFQPVLYCAGDFDTTYRLLFDHFESVGR
jgi:phenylalanine-4-hydroxylase